MSTDAISCSEIISGLRSSFWRDVICHESTGSTNDIALALPQPTKGDAFSGICVVADSQESGRGRFGRKWISPPGRNIYLSMLLRPDMPAIETPLLTITAALACVRALQEETGLRVSVKWPNDLVVSGKKLGGILTEARSSNNVITRAVIGIGINVRSAPKDFPRELSAHATSVLIEGGRVNSRNRIIAALLNEFESAYSALRTSGGAQMVREIRLFLSSLGKMVRVTDGNAVTEGVAEDIDDSGRLIIRLSSGKRLKVGSGEIFELGEKL